MSGRRWLGIVAATLLTMSMAADIAGAQPADRHPTYPKHEKLAGSLLDEAGLAQPAPVLEAAAPWSDEQGRIKVVVEGDSARAAAAVDAAGGRVDAQGTGAVDAYVPSAGLEALAAVPGVTSVHEPLLFQPHVTSEGVVETGMEAWHTGGQTGAGVTVAIVDGGFLGHQALLGTELPATVQTQNHCDNGLNGGPPGSPGIDHGTAVAEIVHDMAPGAVLRLVCIDDNVDFVNAVPALPADVDVVNMSGGNPLWGRGDGSGPVGAAVRQSRLSGKLWVVSAGNSGDRHFNFTGGGVNAFGSVLIGFNNPVYSFTVPSGGTFEVLLKWDAWPATNQDFDLLLYDSAAGYQAGTPVAGSGNFQTGTQPPIEGFAATNTGPTRTFLIEIFAFAGNPAARRFDLYLDGDFTFGPGTVEAVTPGSVSDPATSPYAMAVGAYNVTSGATEAFSSRGPTIDGRVKPDISGPDGVANVSISPFLGTSASAPHTAGAAAVMLGSNATLDVAELQGALESRSLDAGTVGRDNLYGAGRLRMGTVGAPQPPTGQLYSAISPPVRIMDTRTPAGTCVPGPCARLGPGQTLVLQVTGLNGVPSDAVAAILNVTAIGPTGTSHLTVFPTGQALPTAANLNFAAGQVVGNHVTATIGSSGRINFFNAGGFVHLTVDLAGFYSPTLGTDGLVPTTPARIMDTRLASCIGPRCLPIGPGQEVSLPVRGFNAGGQVIPVDATAVVLNVTGVLPISPTHLTIFPDGVAAPNVASLNLAAGAVRGNLVVATIGANGALRVRNAGGLVNVVADVMGYFAPGTGSRYVALSPRRTLDTRTGNGRFGALGPDQRFNHQTQLIYAVPDDATAVLTNVTVVNPTGAGHLTIYPTGAPEPTTANVNFLRGQIVPNAAITKVGEPSGQVTIFNNNTAPNATHVIVDLAGYFVG
jgi:hypothetical protein